MSWRIRHHIKALTTEVLIGVRTHLDRRIASWADDLAEGDMWLDASKKDWGSRAVRQQAVDAAAEADNV